MERVLSELITVVVTLLAHAWVVALLAAIVAGNIYAMVHAWRSGRIGWFLVILLTMGSVATVVYLVIHADEPLPSGSSVRSCRILLIFPT